MASDARQIVPIEWASESQRELFEAPPVPICASGGWGSAKTFACCLKALYLSTVYPQNRGCIFRKVAKELRATTQATFRKICPESVYDTWNQQDGSLKLKNGSEILWMHLEDPDVANVIRGLEINWFFGDQAEEIDEDIWDLLLGRLGRWDKAIVPDRHVTDWEARTGKTWPWKHPTTSRPIPPTYPLIACNPDTDLHWIYNRFHPDSPEWQERWRQQHYRMIQFDSLTNKFLPDQNKQALLQMRPDLARRYVHGLWGIPEGLIHIIPPESVITFDDPADAQAYVDQLRRTCTLFRTLDHGDSSPTCCLWWAVDKDGACTAYREYYQPNKLISYHRERVAELSKDESYVWSIADPSIMHKTAQRSGQIWAVADEWADRRALPADTAVTWIPGDNNELGTRNRISEYLRVDPTRVHPRTKEHGAPRLFFLARSEAYPHGCVQAIRETRAQKRLQVATAGGSRVWTDERDPDVSDHSYDCCSGSTMVLTPQGWRHLVTLVGQEGLVWTPVGWQPFTACRRYHDRSETVQVCSDSDILAWCTPDHLLLTRGGWREAGTLEPGDEVIRWILPSSLPRHRSSTAGATTCAASTFSGMDGDCTGRSGNIITAPFPRGTTSTTSTRTAPTTGWRTSPVCDGENISRNTAESWITRSGWRPSMPGRGGGTAVPPVLRGIGNMPRPPWLRRTSETLKFTASGVVARFWRLAVRRIGLGSAISIAEWLRIATAEEVVGVNPAWNQVPTYCLSVPEPHAFCVDGGIVAHNCLRYFIASRPPVAQEPARKPSRNSFAGQRRLLKQAQVGPVRG